VLIVFALRFAIWGASPLVPFLTFTVSVVFATICFGRGAGIIAAALSVGLGTYYFAEPSQSFAITPDGSAAIALFVTVAGLLVWTADTLRRSYITGERMQHRLEEALGVAQVERRRAEARERDLDLLMVEFPHRVENDLARIGAMLRMQVAGATPETPS
jgi:K+-sensing histidine kinase KdpD